tara:strand:- start:1399 stop:2526 length:1128 start_codon:yes stop_codon:yes gene_type:complete
MKEKIGFIYVLTNTSMPGIVKIGLTKNIKNRISNLSSRTAVPTPFKLYRAIKVKNMFEVENQFKEYFHEQRTNPQREFFTISPEETDPLFDYYNEIGAENFDKTKLPEIKDKDLIDKKVIEFRKQYQKERRIYSINTNFRIIRYNLDGWKSLVKRGLSIFPDNTNPISKEKFKRIYLEKTGKKEVDHNLASHSKIAGIIDISKTNYALTSNGLNFKKDSSSENFIISLKSKIIKNDTLEFYPYIASSKILKKIKELSNIEFLWGIYIMKDTSNNEIEKCIQRIQSIKKINIDYEKFNNLKDLFYIMSVTNDLNFKFKNQIEICQNGDLKKKFEVVDFVGSTLSRLDLEFKYFKNHLTSIWSEKYNTNSLDKLLTN